MDKAKTTIHVEFDVNDDNWGRVSRVIYGLPIVNIEWKPNADPGVKLLEGPTAGKPTAIKLVVDALIEAKGRPVPTSALVSLVLGFQYSKGAANAALYTLKLGKKVRRAGKVGWIWIG